MFRQADNTYNDIRRKSLNQWLDEMENYDDVNVRGGVKLTREYLLHLEKQVAALKEENQLKNDYLKKAMKK